MAAKKIVKKPVKKVVAQPAAPTLDVEQMLATFLKTYETQIVGWVDAGEGVVFDTFVSVLSGRAPLLAALLTNYKAVVLAAGDTVTAQAIDQLIAVLNGTAPTS